MTVRESTGWDRVFWEQDDQWPKGDREHIFLAAAVHEIGAAMFGTTWSRSEPSEGVDFDPVELRFILDDPREALRKEVLAGLKSKVVKSTTISKREAERLKSAAPKYFYHKPDWHVVEWKQEMRCREMVANIHKSFDSFGRLLAVCDWIADRGRDEDLVTVGRKTAGGEFFPLPRSSWNTEQIWERRVRDCTLKHWYGSPPRLIDAYIFLTRKSLGRCLASLPYGPEMSEASASTAPTAAADHVKQPVPAPAEAEEEPVRDAEGETRPAGRKRGRKINPVWASSYARAYKQFREIAIGLSDEQFRDWVMKMNPALGAQASPAHHRSIKSYRERAEAGEFEHFLGR